MLARRLRTAEVLYTPSKLRATQVALLGCLIAVLTRPLDAATLQSFIAVALACGRLGTMLTESLSFRGKCTPI